MKFPNKIFSYHESVISKFPIILKFLKENNEISINDLFKLTNKNFTDINEFIWTIEYLYSLNALDYNFKAGVLIYVI